MILSPCDTALFYIFILSSLLFPSKPGNASTLEFPSILRQAMEHSYDLQIAAADIELKTIKVDEAFSAYYPRLSARLGNEYLRNLDQDAAASMVVGDTLISGNASTYQHSISFSLNYNLFDFGVRGLKYDNIKRDVDIARMAFSQSTIDTKTKVLDLYTEGLKLTVSNAACDKILHQQQEIYTLLQRMFASGTVRKINVAATAIDIAETVQRRSDNILKLQRILKQISYLTREDYAVESTTFAAFPDSSATVSRQPDLDRMPEIVALDLEIERKNAEYEIALLERYPKFTLYSDYKLYGKDEHEFFDSLHSLAGKNSSIGIVVDLPLFQGFASFHHVRGLRQEIDKLKLQRRQKMAELQTGLDSLRDSDRLYRLGSKERREFMENAGQMQEMARKMTEQQLTEQVYYLHKQVEFYEKQLNDELQQIDWAANSLRLQLLAQGAES